MHTLTVGFLLTGVVTGLLMLGSLVNEILTKLVGKFYAYVIMLAGFGGILLYLGLHGAGPTLDSVGSGMLGAALVFAILISQRRTA